MAAKRSDLGGAPAGMADSVWKYGEPTVEWQVQVGRSAAVHIFYEPEEVKGFLRTVDLSAAWNEHIDQGEIAVTIRKIVRHGENVIRIRSEFRVADKDVPAATKEGAKFTPNAPRGGKKRKKK